MAIYICYGKHLDIATRVSINKHERIDDLRGSYKSAAIDFRFLDGAGVTPGAKSIIKNVPKSVSLW